MKKILLLLGDFTEDYEAMVPFQLLQTIGCQVINLDEYDGLYISGRRLTAYPSVAPEIIAAGAEFVPVEGDVAITDVNLFVYIKDLKWRCIQNLS